MKLIAIDMDGTLLSPDLTISKQNVAAIRKAQQEGHKVMICSGRAKESILKILDTYNISCPFGASNGSVTYVDNEIVQATYIPKHVIKEVIQFLDLKEFPYKFYTNQGVYTPSNWKERVMASYQKDTPLTETITLERLERITDKYMQYDHFFENKNALLFHNNDLEIEKIFIFTLQREKRNQLLQDIQQYKGIAATSSAPSNIEVMNKHAHKGNGLRAVAKYFHIPMELTIAIGDNFNDVPMLKAAGFSIAMGNAENEVKDLCDAVTLPNSKNGVAHAIFKYVLQTAKQV